MGPEGSQEMLFQLAGKPATRACMQGYNGTVFCYGQVRRPRLWWWQQQEEQELFCGSAVESQSNRTRA